ncbi:MAG: phage tail tape measure protein, partial [Bacilli bacterium]
GMGVAATIPAAAELEDSMIRVNKLIGMEGEAAKGVQKDMQDMMMATGMGLDQIAAAYETAGGAGIGGDLMAVGDFEGARKEISGFVRTVLEASSAFGMTSDATSSMLSGIANVYKPIGEETNTFLRSVGSGIDAVADATIASEEKIMTAMSHASSAMAMFEQTDATVKDTIALSAALISTNMSGDAAGEAIKDFFNYAKTDAEGNISKSLGMGGAEYQAMLKSDPMAIVEAVTAKYNAMSAEDQGEYSKKFGMTGGKILQLSGSANFQAGLTKAQGVVNPAYDEGTKMSKSFEKSMAGFNTQLSKIGQSITVLAQTIGSIFLPGLIAILGVVNAILSPMVKFVAYVAELAAKIPGMNLIATAASILAVVTAVSALVGFLGPVIAGLGLASKAMLILTMYGNLAVTAITAIGGTVGAIVGILGGPLTIILVLAAAIGYLLYKTGYLQKAWDKFKNSAIGKDLLGGVIAGVEWATSAFTTLFEWLDDRWSEMGEGAAGGLLGVLDSVMKGLGGLFDKVDAAYASGALGKALKLSMVGLIPLELMIRSLGTIAGYASKLIDGSKSIKDLTADSVDWLSKLWGSLSDLPGSISDTIKGWLQTGLDSIEDITTDAVEWLSSLWDNLSDLPDYISDKIKSWLQTSLDSIPNGIVDWLKKLWYTLTSLPSSISSAITGVLPDWMTGGAKEEEGVKSALTEADRDNIIQQAKDAKTSGGYKKFDFGRNSDIWDIAFTEAETGIPQDVPNLQNQAAYDSLVDEFRGQIAKRQSGTSVDSGAGVDITKSIEKAQSTGSVTGPIFTEEESRKLEPTMKFGGESFLNDIEEKKPDGGFIDNARRTINNTFGTSFDVGATFTKGGAFQGKVHEKEEIIPQATAQRGAGPIARALDTLYGVTAGSRSSTSSQKTEVHVHNTNDF